MTIHLSSTAALDESELRPVSVRIRRAVQLTGLSRTKIYELIKTGEIEIVKVGAVTLIPFDSLERYVGSLRASRDVN